MGFFDNEIDISGVSDTVGSEPLPPGEYLMKAVDYDDEAVSSKGNDMMTVDFAFADSQYADRRPIRDYFTFGNNTAYGKLIRWLQACGAMQEKTRPQKEHINRAMGLTFHAKITQEEYNGYINNKIGSYGKQSSQAPQASSGDTTQQATATPAADALKKVEWN